MSRPVAYATTGCRQPTAKVATPGDHARDTLGLGRLGLRDTTDFCFSHQRTSAAIHMIALPRRELKGAFSGVLV